MIRKAELKDVEAIVALGVEFGEKSKSIHTLNVCTKTIWKTVCSALEYPDSAVLLVAEDEKGIAGVIYGAACKTFFSDEIVLQELAWYSRRKVFGFALFKALEAEAKLRGIKKIVVGSKPAFFDLRKVYEKRGYKLLEEQFIKEI